MDDNTFSNITQILTSFDNFVSILEDPLWIRSANAEDIKNGFKLGVFLEKAFTHFSIKNMHIEFFKVLTEWWKSHKNRTKVYDKYFFQFACDQLLIRFFKDENTTETSLDVAIRVYTSIFPKNRLKTVISNVLLLSSSHDAVTDFAKINMTDGEKKDLELSLVLNKWSSLLGSGRESDIQLEIENKLSLYKVESNLNVLVGILSLSGVTDSEKRVQKIVLCSIIQRMLDRSLLSKTFWLTIYKKVELKYICLACENFKEFLVSTFNFVVYIGSMMKNKDGVWESDATVSLCPEITYKEILVLIRNLCSSNHISKNFIIQRLTEAQAHTDSSIWEQIKLELSL